MAALAYRREGSGHPVLLLHPVGLDGDTWLPLSAALASRFTVIRCDLPGHGRSPNLAEGATVSDYAASVAALIDELALGPVALLGASFGGMIAQTVAVEWPQRLRALLPVACPARVPQEASAILQRRGSLAQEGGMQAILQDTLQRWFSPSFMQRDEVTAVAKRLLADDVAGWAAAWTAMSHFDIAARLGSVAVPTLCIAGGKDVSAPVAAMQAIAAAVPGATLTVMDEAPHMLHIEYPDQLSGLVKTFLNRTLA